MTSKTFYRFLEPADAHWRYFTSLKDAKKKAKERGDIWQQNVTILKIVIKDMKNKEIILLALNRQLNHQVEDLIKCASVISVVPFKGK